MHVLKFGGTSVADKDAITRLVHIVRAQRDHQPLVVVSALGGATDRLLAAAAQAAAGDGTGALEEVRVLHERHRDVARLISDPAIHANVEAALDDLFAELSRVLSALSVLEDVSLRWQDAVVASGELASSRIVAGALASEGLPSAWVDARRVMVTNAQHAAALPDLVATKARLMAEVGPLMASGAIPVIGGFIAASREGVTTTLGRGGSDYSAAIIGACLGASEIQIWTDVDGMLTADPRLVPDAQLVPALSFAEAAELAYFGAKVLHPATIAPAMAEGIPVRILNSRRPNGKGSLITADREPSGRPLTAIASKRRVTVVDIASTRMLMAHGFLHRLFGVFEQHATSVDVVTTSEVSVSVTVDDTSRLPQILEDLRRFADVTRQDGMAVLCVVGAGIQGDASFVSALFASLGPIPIRMLSQAAERRNITFVIPDVELPNALTRLHSAFFPHPKEAGSPDPAQS